MRRPTKLLLLVLALFGAVPVQAGMLMALGGADMAQPKDASNSYFAQVGFVGGLALDFSSTGGVRPELDVLYLSRNFGSGAGSNFTHYTMTALQVPLLLRVGLSETLSVAAGPQTTMTLGQIQYDIQGTTGQVSAARQFDLGYVLSGRLGGTGTIPFDFDVRYVRGYEDMGTTGTVNYYEVQALIGISLWRPSGSHH